MTDTEFRTAVEEAWAVQWLRLSEDVREQVGADVWLLMRESFRCGFAAGQLLERDCGD